MRYATALEQHITDKYNSLHGLAPLYTSRDAYAAAVAADVAAGHRTQYTISRHVGAAVAAAYGEYIAYGTFINGREHGLTYRTPSGWVFCAYEHKVADTLHVEGCRVAEVTEDGPYGCTDGWADTLVRCDPAPGALDALAAAVCAAIQVTLDYPGIDRPGLVRALAGRTPS